VNSVERWKRAFVTLSDSAFFDIVRNYLGDIKTPFNKHALVTSLEAFLRNAETRKRIVALVTEEDARILSALDFLGTAKLAVLTDLFQGDIPYLELHRRLLNLEDRLLVYTERGADGDYILINPFLEENLRDSVIGADIVFPSIPGPPGAGDFPSPWMTDSFLIAFLSFLLGDSSVYKAGGSVKKKFEEIGRAHV
jgi:hypothetical protein